MFRLMISKLCASWLVVLVLAPFTAPFSTYDLASPLKPTRRGLPFVPLVAAAGTIDTNAALVPARVMAGRPRLLTRVGHPERTGPPSSVNVTLFFDAIPSIQRQDARNTILRL
jgi:hypothetical protein